ncbi:copper resistance protein NlpE N-terminal domain-containing protein [Luteimonas sp. MC1895]|uniref:copper resistance protein NlpE N-terminal domain-containing protein n=1 Tax=Luteimonas sp. MC1895 TaxID=2819513 RepID=UPI0018F0601E|nr:copper resistance protein NlpE N-terminal domain-containing protein [Luteimonas sp. MC1895]MBJ6978896.1 copper resistance protein NlpE N-terminal domain-containing protein [Luteimonas sp. MC1895]
MPRLHALLVALLLAGVAAGCVREPDDAGTAPPVIGEGAAEWRGRLPCADCEAIDTRLVLERQAGRDRYRLVEVYVAVDGSQSFDEAGEWRLDGQLLSLEPGTGGLRRYALVGGGALQVRDPQGQVFPGREHDLLLPVGRHP